MVTPWPTGSAVNEPIVLLHPSIYTGSFRCNQFRRRYSDTDVLNSGVSPRFLWVVRLFYLNPGNQTFCFHSQQFSRAFWTHAGVNHWKWNTVEDHFNCFCCWWCLLLCYWHWHQELTVLLSKLYFEFVHFWKFLKVVCILFRPNETLHFLQMLTPGFFCIAGKNNRLSKMGGDRFIPTRNRKQMDVASFLLTKSEPADRAAITVGCFYTQPYLWQTRVSIDF